MVKYRTPAEEILLSVQQWYFSRGLRVPADELKICKDEIAVEAATAAAEGALLMRRRVEYEFECAKEEARLAKKELSYEKAAEFIQKIAEYKKLSSGIVEAPPPKASYGSPGFWKDYWAKKASQREGWVPKRKNKNQHSAR